PVDHPDCATIEECKQLGDRYLDALSGYIDIDEEPHIFIENRSRTDYIAYRVDDELKLSGPEHENALPVGTEEEFREIWTGSRPSFRRTASPRSPVSACSRTARATRSPTSISGPAARRSASTSGTTPAGPPSTAR